MLNVWKSRNVKHLFVFLGFVLNSIISKMKMKKYTQNYIPSGRSTRRSRLEQNLLSPPHAF